MAKHLIAVIDDDEPFREALIESLLCLGYAAQEFASADEFLSRAEATMFDCIVTDIHMPGISGLELMDRLADEGVTTPVVLITARADANLPAAARHAAGFFIKPFDLEALVNCMEATRGPTSG